MIPAITCMAVAYLLESFIVLEIDCTKWTSNERGSLVVWLIFAWIISYIVLWFGDIFKKVNEVEEAPQAPEKK